MDFASLGLHTALLSALARLQHTTATAVQAQAIPAALSGQDLLVSSHTGSGKTGAFLLPILHRLAGDAGERRPRVLILTPTRELALQIERAARDYSAELRAGGRRVRTACLIGGAPFGPQLNALAEGAELLIATPGRMLDHLERGRIDLAGVQTLVLDEADRMLDMGFVDDIDVIAARLPEGRQTMMFSATFDGRVAPVARRLTTDPQRIEMLEKIDRALLTEVVHHADDLDHKNRLLDAVLATKGMEQAIIFMSTKLSTEDQAGRLRDAGHAVAALHGDLPQHARNRVVRMLLEGRIQIVVATDVAARGIDVPTISHVINFDLPMKAEDYVHRIGRTARAGRAGVSVSLAGRADRSRLFGIERMLGRALPVATLPGLEPRFAPPRGGDRLGERGHSRGGERRFENRRPSGAGFGGRPGGAGAGGGGYGAARPPGAGFGGRPGGAGFGARAEGAGFGGRSDGPGFGGGRSAGGFEPRPGGGYGGGRGADFSASAYPSERRDFGDRRPPGVNRDRPMRSETPRTFVRPASPDRAPNASAPHAPRAHVVKRARTARV